MNKRKAVSLSMFLTLVAVLLAAVPQEPAKAANAVSYGPRLQPGGLRGKARAADTPSLLFVPNVGQFEEGVRYRTWGGSATIYLTDDALWLTHSEAVPEDTGEQTTIEAAGHAGLTAVPGSGSRVALKISFLGGSSNPDLRPFGRVGTSFNYFFGRDSAGWRTDVPAYAGVRFENLYPGVDLEMTSEAGRWAWRAVCRGDCSSAVHGVRLRVEGAEAIALDGHAFIMKTALGQVALPLLQATAGDGTLLDLRSQAEIGQSGEVFYPFGSTRPVPAELSPTASSDLIYATFLGGAVYDEAKALAIDSDGAAYIAGTTDGGDFPATAGVVQPTHGGGSDVFVAKLEPDGTGLAYCTYLGGSDADAGYDIAVDETGAAYVTGQTRSVFFPVTASAFDRTCGTDGTCNAGGLFDYNDAFLSKLSPDGSTLAYSTYLGGENDEWAEGIAVDDAGAAYVTGHTASTEFPATAGAWDEDLNGAAGTWDAFVTKLAPDGAALSYSTFLGGSNGGESGNDIAVDDGGAAYVTGFTDATDFPTTAGVWDQAHNGAEDVFITRLNSDGSGLAYSTYLGGTNYDYVTGIALGGSGGAYVTGKTLSGDFPLTAGAYDGTQEGLEGFVAGLESDGSGLVYSTFLGGAGADQPWAIAVDGSGTAYVTGGTESSGFPATAGAYDETYNGVGDAFVTGVEPGGSSLGYSTFLGGAGVDAGNGIAVDSGGLVSVTGLTFSPGFPTSSGAFDDSYGGQRDAFVARLGTGDTFSIAGRVTDGNGNPVGGVTVSAGARQTTTTDDSGAYVLGQLTPGTYTVTPSDGSYSFTPSSRVVTVPPDASGQDFTALPAAVSTVVSSDDPATLSFTDTQGLSTTIAFPAGAVTETTTVALTPTLGAGGAGLAFAGHAFELEASVGQGPLAGFTFQKPVTVTIRYSDEDVSLVSDEGELTLMRWSGSGWEDAANTCTPSSTYVRDADGNAISVPICHLSRFALLGPTNRVYLPLVIR